jgi:branched-chain amino acid transport system substrate-binding protein
MRKRVKGMAAMVAVVGLLGSACSEGNNDSGAPATDPSSTEASDTETTGSSEAPTTDAPVVELAVLQSSIDTGLAYTGGPGGVASGEPIKIGYVNQEGGVPSFPDTSVGADSGVWFVNNFLGGVGGRPIELVKCFVVDETDSQKCAQEMLANDEVQAVLVGAMASANLPLLETLKDKKPVFIPNPLTPEEFFATDAYAFTPGGPGVIQGMAVFTAKYLPEYENREVKKVAVLYSENAAGVVAFEVLTKPILEKFGIEITAVPLPDTAGPTEMASAIQSSGAATADVLYPIVTVQGCIGIYDALATLEITIPVVTTGLCSGVPMQDHVKAKGAPGSLPDGWYFGDYGYAYEIPGNPDNDTYIDAALAWARETGVENPEYTGFGRPTFGSLLTLVKFMNDGALDASALRAAAKAFTGPMWAGVGEFKCGGNAAFPSLCGFSIGIQQQQGDTLVSIMDGYNGKALNPIAELAAG